MGIPDNVRSSLHQAKGVIIIFLTGVTMSVLQMFAQLSTAAGMSEFQVLFLLYCPTLVFEVIVLAGLKVNPWPDTTNLKRFFLIGGTFLTFASIVCMYASLLYIPLGTESALMFGGLTMLTPVLSWIILKEKMKWIDGAVIVFDLIGIILVTQPGNLFGNDESKDDNSVYGYILMFVAFPCRSLSYLMVRGLRNDVHWLNFLFYTDIWGAVVCLPLMFVIGVPTWSKSVAGYVVALMVFATMAGLFVTLGLIWEETKTSVFIGNIELAFSYIFQATVVGDPVSTVPLIGAIVIFVASLANGIYVFRGNLKSAGHGENDQLSGESELKQLKDWEELPEGYDALRSESTEGKMTNSHTSSN